MNRQSWKVIAAMLILFGAVVGVVSTESVNTKNAYAQVAQRVIAESIGISRGPYAAADLASFPDGATKLVLRDRNGRLGLILAVYDRPGNSRAQIEFYDLAGRRIRTLNATSPASSASGAAESSGGVRSPMSLPPSDARRIYDQLDDLRNQIAEVRRMVSK